MAIVTGSAVRAAVKFTLDNLPDILYNIWHMRCTNDNAQSQPNLISDLLEVLEDPYDALDGFMSDLINFDNVHLYNVTADAPIGDHDLPTVVAGTDIGEILPHAAAAGLYGETGHSKRIAKKYIPGMTEAYNDDGTWGSSLMTNLAVAAGNLVNPITPTNGSTWQFGIWGWTTPETETGPMIFIPTIAWTANAYPYYQRKRGPGRGD